MYDLIIIGAGPAGVAAAVYAARQKLNLLIIAKDIGGQVTKKVVDIENYPGFEKISGPDLVELYQKQLKFNNLEVLHDEVLSIKKFRSHSEMRSSAESRQRAPRSMPASRSMPGIDRGVDRGDTIGSLAESGQGVINNSQVFCVETKSGEVYEAVSVIVAAGAESRKINVPGEEEFAGKGVSYCSLCDGPIFKDKVVAVVGGGNNGFESAMFLANYVKHVYILEYSSEVNADAENQELVAGNKNIEVITNAKALKIEGKVFVASVTYQDLKSNEEKKLNVDGVFVEIGYKPSTSFAKDLVEMNNNGEIVFNPKTLQTKTEGLFSAGDCNVSKYKQIVMAAGQGATAALSAYEYIKRQHVVKNHYE